MMVGNSKRQSGLTFYSVTILFFLYAPLFILIGFSFNASNFVTVWEGFSFKWFVKVFENDDIRAAALNSVIVATFATIVATITAVPAAMGLERMRGASVGPYTGLFALPLLVPEIVTAVTTLAFFSSVQMRLGLGNLIIAHTVFCIPFAMMPIRARLRGMGEELQHAGSDLYASPARVFLRITLPLLSPAIISGAILSFVVSFDDFVLSVLVGDAGTTTLPVYVYGMIRRGITPEVNAVSTLLLLTSLILAGVAQYLNQNRNPGSDED